VVHDVLASSGPAAAESGVRIERRLPDRLDATIDVVRMERVIGNVVSNALKFTEPGGAVWAELTSDGERWRLTIGDDGIGIAPEDQQRLFQRFQRGSNARAAGSGLGLAISRAIVEHHGGTISLSSELGVGTAVTIEVPLCGGPSRLATLADTDAPPR
jgi:signal transduction histidine kinase